MLTSFFGKSKPIHFLIVSLYLMLSYVFWLFLDPPLIISLEFIVNSLLTALALVFLLLLLDFIIRKNNLTGKNTYAMLVFCCFIILIPAIFSSASILISNLFILLAMRRIVSLNSKKKTQKKILDAALYISIATLFNFWSILFFIVLYFAIFLKTDKKYKEFLIPTMGVFAVGLIGSSYTILRGETFNSFFKINTSVLWDFSAYQSIGLLLAASTLLTLMLWTLSYRILSISSAAKKERPKVLLLIIILLICLLISILTPIKTGAELFFVLAPLAIITTNYIESRNSRASKKQKRSQFWFKEFILWLVVLLPLVVALL